MPELPRSFLGRRLLSHDPRPGQSVFSHLRAYDIPASTTALYPPPHDLITQSAGNGGGVQPAV